MSEQPLPGSIEYWNQQKLLSLLMTRDELQESLDVLVYLGKSNPSLAEKIESIDKQIADLVTKMGGDPSIYNQQFE